MFLTKVLAFFDFLLVQGPKPDLGVPWYGTRYGHNIAEQV